MEIATVTASAAHYGKIAIQAGLRGPAILLTCTSFVVIGEIALRALAKAASCIPFVGKEADPANKGVT